MDASSNEGDPICDRLPPELAMLIFGHLDLRERMNARLVNQRWNEVALNDVQLKLRIHARKSTPRFRKQEGRWVFTDIPATTTADFIQRGRNRSIEPRVDVPGASLNEQIKQLPKALMARVFDIELRLEKGCVPAAGILDDIVSSVVRPIKLHLDLAATRMTPSMFTTSEMADGSIVEQFPTIQLQSLSAVFTFPADGDYSALNCFQMDKPSKDKQHIKLQLERCGQSSNELPFVIERFPQLTNLEMAFGKMWDNDEENRFRAPPDWQTLPQLASLQKLTIKGNSIAGLCAPKLSAGFGLPELRMLHLQNVKLPVNGRAFQGTPKLSSLHYGRCEHENSGNIYARADIQAMTSAMRNRHLKQLTDVAVGFCTDDIATSLEHLQLVCKAVSQNSHACPQFQRLIWGGWESIPLTSNVPDTPSLCKALMNLPAGILSQRPFTLQMEQRGVSEVPENECNELINALHAAVQQSGLKRLRLPNFRLTGGLTATMLCDLINAKPPLSATTDGDNVLRIIWTHPTIEGYEQQVEVTLLRLVWTNPTYECYDQHLFEEEEAEEEEEPLPSIV